MNFSIKSIARFEKEFKRLYKKHPSLKEELRLLAESLKITPEQGTPIGHHCFKIRIAIASKGTGKSGGARLKADYFCESGRDNCLPADHF